MTLLVAGELTLTVDGLVAGAGAIAAIAAAPVMQVQLWARGGGISHQVRDLLARRGIDCAGVDWEQARRPPGASVAPVLPALEPTSADGLRAVLLIGLDGPEIDRAGAVSGRLQPPLTIVAGMSVPHPIGPVIQVLPLSQALAATATSDPVQAGKSLQERGIKTVVLMAGPLGGLIFYGDRITTYPAQPVAQEGSDHAAGAAFAGALAGWCAGAGGDFTAVKRGCALASTVGGLMAQGGVKRLLAADREQYMERYNRLRRNAKG